MALKLEWQGLMQPKSILYIATSLIALTLAWTAYDGYQTYQRTCERALIRLQQNDQELSQSIQSGQVVRIRQALEQTKFETISSVSFWANSILDQQASGAVTVGQRQDFVVCELPLHGLGTIAFQMRPVPFVQAIVARQLPLFVALWLLAITAFFAVDVRAPAELKFKAQAEPTLPKEPQCDAFSSLQFVVQDKRAKVGKKVQFILLRPPGEQNVRVRAQDLEHKLSHWIDQALAFGANSVCLSAKVHGQELRIKMSDNHAQESTLTLPI